MTAPTLSVAMANYNKAGYLRDALDSILEQSFQPKEIVIVDDFSIDNSIDIIEEYTRRHANMRLIRNDKNMGPMYSYNHAVVQCTSQYVYMMGCDDNIFPGFFEKSMGMLKKHPEAGLCTSNPVNFFEKPNVSRETQLLWSKEPRYFSPDEFADVLQGSYISCHSTIVKRSALLESGMQLEPLKWHSDWFLWLVVAFRHGICYIPEPLAVLRVVEGSYSSGAKDWPAQREVLVNLLKELKSAKYRDVLPFFCRGSAMSHFGTDIVRAVMSNPELWDTGTLMLIQHPLWLWNIHISNNQQARMQKLQQKEGEEKMFAVFERGRVAMTQGRLDEAYSIFAELTREFPDMVKGHVALAQVAAARGELNVALNALKKAIELKTNDPELHNQLGTLYYHIGDHEMAKYSYQHAMTLDPANLNACMNLAEMAEINNSYNEAAGYYNQALKEHPDNTDLLVATGRLALEVGEPEGAQAAFQRALDLDPTCEIAREVLRTLGEV